MLSNDHIIFINYGPLDLNSTIMFMKYFNTTIWWPPLLVITIIITNKVQCR